MNLREFLGGFVEETAGSEIVLPDIRDGAIGTPDDLIDYATKDNVIASIKDDNGERQGTESEPVRLINQTLDFMGDVTEEVVEWIERETGEGHRVQPGRDFGLPMLDATIGTDTWKATQYNVDREIQMVRRTPYRRFVRMVNTGPGVVSISVKTRANGGAQSNTFSLPVSKLDGTGPYTPVELPSVDEVWAVPAVLGTGATVEVMDVYGIPDGN